MIDEATKAQLLREMEESERERQAIAATLPAHLPPLTKIVMAGDLAGWERVKREVEAGADPVTSLIWCGSYARIAHLVWLVETGRVDRRVAVTELLPAHWPRSDPDDTDEKLLNLWRDARSIKGDVVLDDETKPLPKREPYTIWRGQMPGDPVGFAWSLKRNVALRFARGASLRVPVEGGILIKGRVYRDAILAYLTERNEDEVIVEPASVTVTRTESTTLTPAQRNAAMGLHG